MKMQSKKISIAQAAQQPLKHEIDDFIEPCFLDKRHWIKSPPTDYAQKTSTYLLHQIARRPFDLVSHTQRVCLYRDLGDAEGIYGALLDLFIVLGDKGQALRQRLLQQSAFILTAENYEILSDALSKALTVSARTAQSHHSALSFNKTEDTKVIRKVDQTPDEKEEEPLLVATDLLNSGQVEQAQAILEASLLANPEIHAISEELLHIYRHTNNRDGCIQMLKRLASSQLAARDQWLELVITLDQYNDEESISA